MKAEKLIKDYTKRCSNVLCAVEDKYGKKVISYHEWLTPDQALSAVKIAMEEVIEKACDAFCKVRCKGKPPRSTCTSLGTCREYDDFKKYVEERLKERKK